jgi:outer membrane protein OmpA-like peptidoglycan-associated protein
VAEWHNINDPGLFKPAKPRQSTAPVEYVTDAAITKEDTADEVKLSDPQFFEGEEGYEFNKKCGVKVRVEYLKETFRKKVTFALFSDYKGEVQDMHLTVDGDEESGVAETEVTLYYNDAHYPDYCSDPSTSVDYFFKATHPRAKEVESPRLTMPRSKETAKRVRLVGMLFDANKCFLLPQGLPGIKTIIAMHNEEPKAEVLIVGHAGGDEDLAGADIAFDRAQILGAYLKSKPNAWLNWFGPDKSPRSRWGTREIQLMLSVLPEGETPLYEGYALGITDEKTTEAIKGFQEYMNKEKVASLPTDGKADFETRKALVEAYMAIEDTTLGEDVTPIAHGCEGHFEDTKTETGVTADDRRLEVFFFKKAIDPRPEAAISSEGAADYPKWLSKVIETKDFEHHGIHVQIIDSEKQPAPFATVHLKGPTNAEATADEHGFVSFFGLKAGEYTISSEKDGYKIGVSKIVYPTAKSVKGCAKTDPALPG